MYKPARSFKAYQFGIITVPSTSICTRLHRPRCIRVVLGHYLHSARQANVRIHLCTVSFGSVSPEARGPPCRGLSQAVKPMANPTGIGRKIALPPTSSIQPMPIIIRTRYATLTPSSLLLCTALVPTSYLHAYLIWPFPHLFDRCESTNKSSLSFRQSSPLLKSGHLSSLLASFCWQHGEEDRCHAIARGKLCRGSLSIQIHSWGRP